MYLDYCQELASLEKATDVKNLLVCLQVKILEKATYGMAESEDEQLVVVSQVFVTPDTIPTLNLEDGLK